MRIVETESNRKSHDDNYQPPPNERVAQIIAEKFALTLPHAHEIARLAGLGDGEARR
jgi:hypothetical protein